MTYDNLNCRWFPEDSKFQDIYQTAWFYMIQAEYDKARGVMNVDGKVANCDGNGCKRFLSTKRPFHTELKMINGRLFGTGLSDDPNDKLELVRVSDEEERAYDANTAEAEWLKVLDAGDFNRFYDLATSASFRSTESRKDLIDKLSTQRDRAGMIMSRQTKIMNIELAPFISKSPGEYVLFWSGVESTKSDRGLEFMLLVKDGSTWKVTWLNYGA